MQPVKFYQTGTFTVGNRLLDQESAHGAGQHGRAPTRSIPAIAPARVAARRSARAMQSTPPCAPRNEQIIAANATGCLEVFSTPYPETSWQIPWMHSLFGNAAAVATGVAAAMKVQGRNDVRVIAQGGDGGTTDIGFGCLSGMFERNDDVLYICYDNEAYMNTGVQRSSATPPAARTATTCRSGRSPATRFGQGKNVPLDCHGARHSLRRHRIGRRPARPGRQSDQGDVDTRRALHPYPGALPARLGRALAARRSTWRGWRWKPACSRCLKRSMAT